jgi:GDP-L-fucose synthase
MHEDALLTGKLEPINEAYAIAKIAGIGLCHSYRRQHGSHFFAAIPTNLFGPEDNSDPMSVHSVQETICKMAAAKRNGASSRFGEPGHRAANSCLSKARRTRRCSRCAVSEEIEPQIT